MLVKVMARGFRILCLWVAKNPIGSARLFGLELTV